MSDNQSATTGLRSKRFEFDVLMEDPPTGLEFTFPLEVDTGNPIALALPRYCEQFFTQQVTTVDLGGAGSTNSPAYEAKIKDIDGIGIDYDTMAVMTLEDSNYGLLGVELLKYMKTEVFDDPSNKKLRLEATHL